MVVFYRISNIVAVIVMLFIAFVFTGCNQHDASPDTGNNNTGVGGSMARFTITKNHLFVVEQNQLQVFDLLNPLQPDKKSQTYLGDGIETLYPCKDHLFIGSQNSMMIYNISNPSNPTYVSTYMHVQACDPVVVNDNFAYVTLRNGTECRRTVNRLEILDISDLRSPRRIFEYDLYNPHGLGIDGNLLFICEGKEGLKVFDVENPFNIKSLQHLKGFETYDVIPRGKLLMVIGADGLLQFDYTDPTALELLSTIKVQ